MKEALTWVTDDLTAHSVAPASPATLLFLVRRYPDAASPGLHAALARALDASIPAFESEQDARIKCRWLGAFADASVMVADEALSALVDERLPETIEGLERFVRRVYEPGEGAVGDDCDGQVRLALALLVAFDLTARLPYAMLAEELLQSARRISWKASAGEFDAPFITNCLAAQAWCRLAALHRDSDYAARAVVAPGARYRDDAETLLARLQRDARDQCEAMSEYGLALLDWFALNALPN